MAFSATSASADLGNGNNCVGSNVSALAHATQQQLDVGFGAYAKSIGSKPGQLIQAYDAGGCDS
jgi:hypothetical protein